MPSVVAKTSKPTCTPGGAAPFILAVGGGKGGTGKSVVAVNLARFLAGEGLKVILADLDLGGANLHLMTGLRRCRYTLRDFISGRVRELSQLLVAVPELKLELLPGSDEVAGVVQPGYQRKLRLVRHLHRLPADVVVCDLGGNSNLDTLDLFNESDWGMVVTTLEPTAVQNCYGFLKAATLRRLVRMGRELGLSRERVAGWWSPNGDGSAGPGEIVEQVRLEEPAVAQALADALACLRPAILVNMAGRDEARRVFGSLQAVGRRFLDMQIEFLGWIPPDPQVGQALLHGQVPRLQRLPPLAGVYERVNAALEPGFAVGCNEEVRVGDQMLHVQTEDLGSEICAYHSLVYSGGHIVLSKRVEYQSAFFQRAPSRLKQDCVRFLHRTIVTALQTGRLPVTLPAPKAEANTPAGETGHDFASGGH